MQVVSKLRYAHISPQKCRLVADVVRGKPVGNAISTLKYMPKKGADLVRKVLESAVANAEHQGEQDVDALTIRECNIDNGPILKRWMPRAMGRANRIQSRTSHVTVVVENI